MSEPLLDVSDLQVDIPLPRGTVRAVDGVSFSVASGHALGLVGESGCGKSMTLRAILGLLPRPAAISGGQVMFDGLDLVIQTPRRMRDVRGRSISMIFQEPMTALNPVMRVGDQIAEGPQYHLHERGRAAKAKAIELMRIVGIPDPKRRARAYPHELSGGMRQRVMIAIALSCSPKLLLCDEPTTALDVTIQDQILRLLLSLRQETGVGVVFVTHDLAVVAQTCDSVAVMYAGEVVETGLVADVFREPRHPYTLGLLRSVPDFERVRATQLSSIPGTPPDLASHFDGCRFAPRCQYAQPDCVSGRFPLRNVAEGRASTCIHHDSPADAARRDPVTAGG
jgi:oligopeptide/dipeptide ABC transporter ATP-binding protein